MLADRYLKKNIKRKHFVKVGLFLNFKNMILMILWWINQLPYDWARLTGTNKERKIWASFNRDLNRGCLVYMFSLRFSGSKFLINLRRQFRACGICSCTQNFSYTSFCGICSLFILCLKLLFQKCVTFTYLCSRLLFH